MSTNRNPYQFRTEIAKETWSEELRLVNLLEKDAPKSSYVMTLDKHPALQKDDPKHPKCSKTLLRVIPKDTLDAAQALEEAKDILGTSDQKPVLVLNFANAHVAGGGWKQGCPAQEEQIAYRSTLITTLPKKFYPMGPLECIYSPTVYIFRENEAKGYSYMWNTTSPKLLPKVGVISLAAEDLRGTKGVKNGKWTDPNSGPLMMQKMRLVLRSAARNGHRRLVLGALGCGAFGHPAGEVAPCWKTVLQEPEFEGWFEIIIFAIFTPRGNPMQDVNFSTFHNVLKDEKWGNK